MRRPWPTIHNDKLFVALPGRIRQVLAVETEHWPGLGDCLELRPGLAIHNHELLVACNCPVRYAVPVWAENEGTYSVVFGACLAIHDHELLPSTQGHICHAPDRAERREAFRDLVILRPWLAVDHHKRPVAFPGRVCHMAAIGTQHRGTRRNPIPTWSGLAIHHDMPLLSLLGCVRHVATVSTNGNPSNNVARRLGTAIYHNDRLPTMAGCVHYAVAIRTENWLAFANAVVFRPFPAINDHKPLRAPPDYICHTLAMRTEHRGPLSHPIVHRPWLAISNHEPLPTLACRIRHAAAVATEDGTALPNGVVLGPGLTIHDHKAGHP